MTIHSTDFNPDYNAEAHRRQSLYEAYASIEQEHGNAREVFRQTYKDNPVQFIEDWTFTYDPRNVGTDRPTTMPFLLFPKQVELVEWFHNDLLKSQDNGLIEKARDMGATWVACAYSVYLWLFKEGAAVGWGSRKEALVDRLGDASSIFEKIRQIIKRLPFFALPENYNEKNALLFMKCINPENGATIIGEAGDNIGRGGRTLIYFKDESAHYERPELIEAALADNTNIQVDISSVNGTGNIFYRKRTGGIVKVFVMDWRDHPWKTQAWYDKRKAKAEGEGLLHIFAQEVDRDYASSVEGVIIPGEWVKSAIDAHIKLGLKIEGDKQAGLDVADEGGDTNALAIRDGIVLIHLSEWAMGDTEYTSHNAALLCKENKCDNLFYDSIGVGAGVKAQIKKYQDSLSTYPFNGSCSPWSPNSFFTEGKTNGDMFKNLKAQQWWVLRSRFEKTHKAVEAKKNNQVYEYNPDELISLPSNLKLVHRLTNELSQPTRTFDMVGRLLVNKKPDGNKSPNLADSLMMAYSHGWRKKIRLAFG